MIRSHTPSHLQGTADEDLPWTCSSPKSKVCATPGCAKRRRYGLFGSFCKPHADRLAAIRQEMEEEMAQHGRYKQRRGQRKLDTFMGSTCCQPGCTDPRDRGEDFCEAHLLADAA